MVAGRVSPNRECMLWRTWLPTDMTTEDRDFHGVVAGPFAPPTEDQQLVAVDWSETGWVQLTWLVTRDMPNPRNQ